MKNIRIGIIGGTGGIGKWFAHFFQKEGFEVQVTGRKTGLALPVLTRQCPIIIVSVPIKATVEVIEQVGPLMPEKSLLMDFTSLKEEPVKAMLRSSCCEVIGLHPLFGPEIKSPGRTQYRPLSGPDKKMAPQDKGRFKKKPGPNHRDHA
jgi:prephenate dehydrogenase